MPVSGGNDRRLDSDPERATEPPGAVVRLSPIVIHEDTAKAAITKQGAAELPHINGSFYQLDDFVSKLPSFCSSRYSSSVKSSMPMAAARSTALFLGLNSFLESNASRS